MKYFFSIIAFCVFTLFCFSLFNWSSLPSEEADYVLVGKKTEKGNNITATEEILSTCFTRFETFKRSQPSDFEIEYFQETDAYFLNAKGTDAKGGEMLMRVSLHLLKDNSLQMPKSSLGESCAGNPCNHCTFRASGGCNPCTKPLTGTCNHTVTRGGIE